MWLQYQEKHLDLSSTNVEPLSLSCIVVKNNYCYPQNAKLIMVLSNYSFQYCDSNIKVFSIAPCRIIAIIFCFLFGISSLLLFMTSSSNYRDSCLPFSLFEAIAKRHLANAFKIKKKNDNFCYRDNWMSDNYTESNSEKKATNQCTKLIQKMKQRG